MSQFSCSSYVSSTQEWFVLAGNIDASRKSSSLAYRLVGWLFGWLLVGLVWLVGWLDPNHSTVSTEPNPSTLKMKPKSV